MKIYKYVPFITLFHFIACAKEKEVKVAIHILLNMLWQVQMTSQKLRYLLLSSTNHLKSVTN